MSVMDTLINAADNVNGWKVFQAVHENLKPNSAQLHRLTVAEPLHAMQELIRKISQICNDNKEVATPARLWPVPSVHTACLQS